MTIEDDVITLNGADLQERIALDFGIPVEAIDNESCWLAIEFLKRNGADVWDSSIMFSRGMLLANSLGYYVINVKKSTWTLLGFFLDLLLTSGAATATLGALGVIGRSIGKLNERVGEVCVYAELLRDGDRTSKKIHASMRQTCKLNNFDCRFKNKAKNTCHIPLENVRDNLIRMKEKGAVTETADKGWKLEF